MVGREQSPPVEIYQTEEEALWTEWERRGDYDQGSSTESDIPLARPSTRGVYSQEAGPSSRGLGMEDVMIEDLRSVKSCGNFQAEEVGT